MIRTATVDCFPAFAKRQLAGQRKSQVRLNEGNSEREEASNAACILRQSAVFITGHSLPPPIADATIGNSKIPSNTEATEMEKDRRI
jgi:hypothetical protein